MDRFNEVLINREWCILFNLSKEQASNYGWIGGNILMMALGKICESTIFFS